MLSMPSSRNAPGRSSPRLGVDAREDALIVRQKVEPAVVEQRRRNVRRAAKAAPGDLVGAGDVPARAVEANRQQGPLVVAAAGEDHAVGRHRRSDDVRRQPAAFPQHVAVGQIIAADAAGAADDHLRFASMLDDDRRGPGSDFVPLDLPPLLPVRLSRATRNDFPSWSQLTISVSS